MNACQNESLVLPVHQDDADNEEGDGDGKEVGCRYAVWHCLGPDSITRSTSRVGGRDSSLTIFNGGVAVVAVKHHTLREVTLPGRADKEEI